MFRIVDLKQFWSGLLFLIIGLVALWKLPANVGTATEMGPGYFPMLLGICLVVFGSGSVIIAIRSNEPNAVGRVPLVPLAFIFAGVLIFAALIDTAGLAIALLGLTTTSCYARLRQRPLEVLATYVALLVLTWAIFIRGIQLPISLLP